MKILYAITLLFIPLCSFTQTLYKADLRPQVGETYKMFRVTNPDSINPGNSGTGQTWDLSNLDVSQQHVSYLRVINASSAPHSVAGASYSILDYQLNDPSNINYGYYRDTADSYYELQYIRTEDDTKYNNPMDIYKFPWSFNTLHIDNFCYTGSSSLSTNYICGTARIRFDGTGTLKLPGMQALENVVRLKKEEAGLNYQNPDPTDSFYMTTYYWYKPGVHHSLAWYTEYHQKKSGLRSKYGVVSSTGNNVSVDELEWTKFFVYPNPCKDLLTVQAETELQSIVLKDILGNEVGHFTNDSGTFSMETSWLANGVYMLIVDDGSRTIIQKVVVNHN